MNPNTTLDIRTCVARLAAPSLGLLVFSAMILRGLYAGNAPDTVLTRALLGLLGGVVLGSLAGAVGERVLRDTPAAKVPSANEEASRDGVAASGA